MTAPTHAPTAHAKYLKRDAQALSTRLNSEHVLITRSGCHKGELTEQDLLLVDLSGTPLTDQQTASAETLLHTTLYALDKHIGAVLHTHSIVSTVLSRITPPPWISFNGWEMQKSLTGNTTHQDTIRIAVFDNCQNMPMLANALRQRWTETPLAWGFLVRGHGLYSWGDTIESARRHLEGLEFLFACQLELQKLNITSTGLTP
ncbi:MAG: methylthioribulose 1-phosphate dehydratase [Gammaproteobacteria bacterium]